MSESRNGVVGGYSRRRHYLRRLGVQLFHTRRFYRLQRDRHEENAAGYSLRGFDELKCIFVHIPKCAGVSVCRSLFGNLGGGHKTLEEYQVVFSPEDYARYFKFTFVRNPWDRLVSAFLFLKRGGLNAGDKAWAAKNLSRYNDFGSFVREGLQRREILSFKHFQPQHGFICLEGKEPRVDFLGRYEKLASDFEIICQRLNVESKLGRENQNSSRADYGKYYTPETRQIVGEVYGDDIEIFGYSFGKGERQECCLTERQIRQIPRGSAVPGNGARRQQTRENLPTE